MEEIFKNLEPPFDGYKISNFGKIINPKGKECKPFKCRYKGYTYLKVQIIIRRKNLNARKCCSLATEVYKAFGVGYIKGCKIYHKDGDVFNCKIDNLFIAKGYITPHTNEQIEIYINNVIPCVKHYVGVKKLNDYADICDIDGVIGESYLLIWKHLSQFKLTDKFYSFCAQYVQWAFLSAYKKAKREQEFINNYGVIIKNDLRL